MIYSWRVGVATRSPDVLSARKRDGLRVQVVGHGIRYLRVVGRRRAVRKRRARMLESYRIIYYRE